jgi:cobalt-zinc-cadmium efflux system outer membrane protein
MRPLGAVALVVLAVTPPASGGAQEAPLTFQSALDLAVANNLDLAAARRGRGVREAELRTARQYPNPELSAEAARDVPHETLSLDLPLEVFGQRSRRIDLAREQLKLSDLDEKTALQTLRREVRLAFYGLLGADQTVALAQTLLEVSERVRQGAETRVQEGAAPRLDLMQAELGLSRARAELDLARSERRGTQAELNALLNRPAGEPIALAGDLADAPPLPDLARATTLAGASNLELQAAEREVTIEERQLALLKAERWPVPVLSLGADFDAPGEFDVGPRAGLSLAVPLFSRNQGGIAGSLARIGQQRLRRDAMRRAVEARVVAALAKAEAQRAQAESFRQALVPTATSIEELAEESYRLGRTSLLAVFDAQRSLRDVKSEALQSLLTLQGAIADLEDVLGEPLE